MIRKVRKNIVAGLSISTLLMACSHNFEERNSPLEMSAPLSWKQWSGPITSSQLNWHSFNDIYLNALISEALKENLNLESARRTLQRAIIQDQVNKGSRSPLVNFNAAASRNGQLDGGSVNSFSLSVPASYEVDLWGRRGQRIENSEIFAELARIDLQTSRISIAALVAEFYFGLRSTDRLILLKERSLASIVKQREITDARVRGGVATVTDLDRQDVQVADLQASIEDLRSTRKQTENRLAVLLGKSPQDFSFQADQNFDLASAPLLTIGTPLEVLRHRPDIKSAELRLASAHVSAELVRTRLFPSLAVSVSASANNSNLSNIFDFVFLPWDVASNFSAPLLDGGARRAELELAELDLDNEVTFYKDTILNALVDLESAFASEESLRRQQETIRRQSVIQERISEETKVKFNSGRASSLDLIIEEQNLIRIEEAEVSLWRQSMLITISLLRATGVEPSD